MWSARQAKEQGKSVDRAKLEVRTSSEAANIPVAWKMKYLQAVIPIQTNYLKATLLLGRTLPM
jgi:hypothetical protein